MPIEDQLLGLLQGNVVYLIAAILLVILVFRSVKSKHPPRTAVRLP